MFAESLKNVAPLMKISQYVIQKYPTNVVYRYESLSQNNYKVMYYIAEITHITATLTPDVVLKFLLKLTMLLLTSVYSFSYLYHTSESQTKKINKLNLAFDIWHVLFTCSDYTSLCPAIRFP